MSTGPSLPALVLTLLVATAVPAPVVLASVGDSPRMDTPSAESSTPFTVRQNADWPSLGDDGNESGNGTEKPTTATGRNGTADSGSRATETPADGSGNASSGRSTESGQSQGETGTNGTDRDRPESDPSNRTDSTDPSGRTNSTGPSSRTGPTENVTRGTYGRSTLESHVPRSARGGHADDNVVDEDGESPDPPARANATVRGVPGESAAVNVSAAATDDLGVSRLNVTVTRRGTYALNVTVSERPLASSPAFRPADGGVVLGVVRVNHTVSDRNVSGVSFTFRVSESRLAAANAPPGDVALYRYHDGTWNALPTTFLRKTNGTYVFRARSPGLSDFTVAAKKPSFEVAATNVTDTEVSTGDEVGVRVRIRNVGDADGTYTTKLLFDGEVVATRQVTIAADGTRQVSFERRFSRPGEYTVRVNNVTVGTVEVAATPTATRTAGGTGTRTGSTGGTAAGKASGAASGGATGTSAPGFGAVVASVAVTLVAVMARKQ